MILDTRMEAKGCHWVPFGFVPQVSQERVPKHDVSMDRKQKAFQ